jgi:hypothetical protein
MQQPQRNQEIERNYAAFQSAVAALAQEHEGKFALMRHGEVVDVYAELLDAVVAGHSAFSDGMFSIQEVTMKPLDLGFYSHANPAGPIC